MRRVVARIELVSTGNKDRLTAVRNFVDEVVGFLVRGVNLLVIDLLGPTQHDPDGIDKLIWNEVREEPFELSKDKPMVLASCVSEPSPAAYVESVGAGDVLPDMPLFHDLEVYVPVPLEATYAETRSRFLAALRDDVLYPDNSPPADSAD